MLTLMFKRSTGPWSSIMGSHSDSNGRLVFVLKLKDFQVVKGHQPKHVSLTLMNRALKVHDKEVPEEDCAKVGEAKVLEK